MKKFNHIFQTNKALIGVVHIQALPGTPNAKYSMQQIIDTALKEARIYAKNHYDGIIVENMHDLPYCKNHQAPEITASMAVLAHIIKQETKLPLGMQILAAANEAAIAAANAAQADFIRAEGFVFSHIADEGFIDGCAGNLLRYRKKIAADNIAVFTDIKKKHSSHAITDDVDIVETAKAAEFFMSDGIILSGPATGTATSIEELIQVTNAINTPVLIGSGLSSENIKKYFPYANGFIVGSSIKQNGLWSNAMDELATEKLADIFNDLINTEKK